MDQSSLGRLPPELRNWIYELVLIRPDPITITVRPGTLISTPEPASKHPLSHATALLQTCRQIRREASSICYADNTFVFEHVRNHSAKSLLRLFNRNIGAPNAKALRRITFHAETLIPEYTLYPFYVNLFYDAAVLARSSDKRIVTLKVGFNLFGGGVIGFEYAGNQIQYPWTTRKDEVREQAKNGWAHVSAYDSVDELLRWVEVEIEYGLARLPKH